MDSVISSENVKCTKSPNMECLPHFLPSKDLQSWREARLKGLDKKIQYPQNCPALHTNFKSQMSKGR